MKPLQTHFLFLLLLAFDWACDTHFGQDCMTRPMASSQVTLCQARGPCQDDHDGNLTAPALDLFALLPGWCLPPSGLVHVLQVYNLAGLPPPDLIYLFMSLRR